MQYHLLQTFQRAQLRNDLAGLLSAADTAVAHFPNIAAFRIGQALILARSSHKDLALELLHEVAADSFLCIPHDTLWLWLLTVLAEVATIVSHEAYERTLYELLLPYASEYVVAAWGTLLDGSVAHYLALLADSLGLHAAACEHFESAIAANRRIGAPALTARSSLHYALHLRSSAEQSQIEKARAFANRAAGTFLSLDLPEHAKQAQQLSDALKRRTALKTRMQPAPRLPADESNIFRREGDFWTIAHRGRSTLLRATLGLQYIGVLLSTARRAHSCPGTHQRWTPVRGQFIHA